MKVIPKSTIPSEALDPVKVMELLKKPLSEPEPTRALSKDEIFNRVKARVAKEARK
ncbi:hypothetical protein [Agarilytica rhodophyticola]|uniref:hypothetical protein n=1 Tax=Agarilytica rhodophyticola TaxID=1737490 RepID=UPI00131599B9|nr:hypothetical protein [Agarilytica rhodophyticola]